MRILTAVCALALASSPALLLAQAPTTPVPSPFGERVDVNIVNVEVWVTDKDGNPVHGLQRSDFELREDGKALPVVNFEAFSKKEAAPAAPPSTPGAETRKAGAAAPDAMHLVIYVDNTFLVPAHRNRVLQQLRDFIGRLSPESEVMLVTEDPALKVRQAFTRDRAALLRTVDAIETSGALGVSHASAKAQAIDTILNIRETYWKFDPCPSDLVQPARSYADQLRADVLRSLGAMTVLVNSLSGVPGRKAMLLVSDGMPVTPGEEVFQTLVELCDSNGTSGFGDPGQAGPAGNGHYDASQAALDAQSYDTTSAFRAFTGHANAQRVTVYALEASGLAGAAAAAADIGPRERVLQLPGIQLVETSNLQNSLFVLASDTGGRAILNANDLAPSLAHIQEDFASYYSLAYTRRTPATAATTASRCG